MRRLIVGISGASGVAYGVRLLQVLQPMNEIESHLVISDAGRATIAAECDLTVKEVESYANVVHANKNVGASIASGSFKTDGMIIAPCSMKTLSGIVHSYADNLLVRAADVALKDRRALVILPRETPLHVGHCKLLYEAAQLGAIIMPPMPAFYAHPETIEDLVDHSVGRVLDMFDIEADLVMRWQGLGHPD